MTLCVTCQRKTDSMCDHIEYYQDGLCKFYKDRHRILDHKPDDLGEEMFPTLPKREERKWDKGKLKHSLIIPEFLELMAEILTRGEINHPKEPDGTPSWQLVEPVAYQDALERHFIAYKKGQMIDPDPKMPTHHAGNIAINAMFLWWFSQQEGKSGNNG